MIRSIYNYTKYSHWCKPEYEEIIENQINTHKIVIIGLSWCPWTIRSKSLIKESYIENPLLLIPDIVDNDYKINMLYCLSKKVNTVNVPQIFIDKKHIGDFEHLYKRIKREQMNLKE